MIGKLDPKHKSEFESFYLSNCGFLYYEAGKYFRREEDKEDCVQSILQRLMENAVEFLQSSHKRKLGYISRAIRNYAIDFARQENRLPLSEYIEDTINTDPIQDGVLDKIISEEEWSFVRRCLYKVSKKYRDVLELYYYDNMDSYQIADTLNLKQSSVLTYLKRGHAEMKEIMRENGYQVK